MLAWTICISAPIVFYHLAPEPTFFAHDQHVEGSRLLTDGVEQAQDSRSVAELRAGDPVVEVDVLVG
jgi:hypothetical protein